MSLDDKNNDEDFVPPSDWDRKKESDTLILMLPGFTREQLKVLVSSDRRLTLSGARKISDNKWRRFSKVEQLYEYHDTGRISAKFEAGILFVKIPKVIKVEEPSKPDQQQTTPLDQKPDSQQPSSAQKDQEQTKTDHDQDSQKKPEEEKRRVVPEEKTKISEDKEMQHETTQTALEDQNKELRKKLSQKEEHHEDVQKKLAKKEEDHEDVHQKKLAQKEEDHEDVHQKKLAQKELDDKDVKKEKEKGKAEITTDGNMGRGSDEGLSKRSVVKMKQWFDMICGLVEEVKKQKKVPHFVVLIFLVLVFGLYIKSLFKPSFGGDKDQEF